MERMHAVVWSKRRQLKRAALAVAVGLAVAAASATVLAAPPRRAAGPVAQTWQAPAVGYGWQALGLTDEQIAKINDIQQKANEQALPIRSELFAKRQELALALRSSTLDPAKVKELVARINELEGQLAQIHIQAQLDVRGVLTDEQRAKLGTLGFGGFGGRGAGFGRGGCVGYGAGGYGHMGRGMGRGYGMMEPGRGW